MQNANIARHVIVYTYKRKRYISVTKPCTYAAAKQSFYDELNTLNTFTLVQIYEADEARIALLQKLSATNINISV
jgi:hypothetical protein